MGGTFYSSETPESCYEELLNRVLPCVLDRQFSSMFVFEQELGRLSQNRFVRAAVETAAWDLMPVNGPHLSAAARLAINLLKRAARIALEVAFPPVVMRHRTCINAR